MLYLDGSNKGVIFCSSPEPKAPEVFLRIASCPSSSVVVYRLSTLSTASYSDPVGHLSPNYICGILGLEN